MPELNFTTPETAPPVELAFAEDENGGINIMAARGGSTPVAILTVTKTGIFYRQPGLSSALGFQLDASDRVKTNDE